MIINNALLISGDVHELGELDIMEVSGRKTFDNVWYGLVAGGNVLGRVALKLFERRSFCHLFWNYLWI